MESWPASSRCPGSGSASSLLPRGTWCLTGAGRGVELGSVDWMWRMLDRSVSALSLRTSRFMKWLTSDKCKLVWLTSHLRWSSASCMWPGYWRPAPVSRMLLRLVSLSSVSLSWSDRNLIITVYDMHSITHSHNSPHDVFMSGVFHCLRLSESKVVWKQLCRAAATPNLISTADQNPCRAMPSRDTHYNSCLRIFWAIRRRLWLLSISELFLKNAPVFSLN